MIRSRTTLASIEAAAIERQVRSPLISFFAPPTKSQLPSTTTSIRGLAQLLERPSGRQTLRIRHPQLVAFGRAGMTHGPVVAPFRHPCEHRLPLGLGEELRVSDLVDPAVARNHRDSDGERTGPRAPAHFVDPNHGLETLLPQLSLETQSGSLVDQERSEGVEPWRPSVDR